MKNLTTILENGEDHITEFKSGRFHNESLAKEVVAFSNSSGGSIFIGIEDDGSVSGIEDRTTEERVINICRNLIEPSVLPEIFIHWHVCGKKVLEVAIPKGLFKPYKIKGQNRFYVRVGTVSIEPSMPELIRLLQSGGLYHFEITALPGTSLSDLDWLRFREYCQTYRKIEFEQHAAYKLLENWQLIDSHAQLTVVGVLFFASNVEKRLPQCGIQLFRFIGRDSTGAIADQKELSAPIPDSIDAAVKFVQFNSAVRGVFSDGDPRRTDVPDYDFFVVRELISNAFCHRDWSIFGQKIRLSLFDDRLELFSPGALPNTLTLENALAGISFYRNPNIAQLCRDYGLVEKAGRGLQKIVAICRQLSLPPPQFQCDSLFIKTIVYKTGSHIE
jgi:ATP-dependent DNA helicase RecG